MGGAYNTDLFLNTSLMHIHIMTQKKHMHCCVNLKKDCLCFLKHMNTKLQTTSKQQRKHQSTADA